MADWIYVCLIYFNVYVIGDFLHLSIEIIFSFATSNKSNTNVFVSSWWLVTLIPFNWATTLAYLSVSLKFEATRILFYMRLPIGHILYYIIISGSSPWYLLFIFLSNIEIQSAQTDLPIANCQIPHFSSSSFSTIVTNLSWVGEYLEYLGCLIRDYDVWYLFWYC